MHVYFDSSSEVSQLFRTISTNIGNSHFNATDRNHDLSLGISLYEHWSHITTNTNSKIYYFSKFTSCFSMMIFKLTSQALTAPLEPLDVC